MIQSAKKFLTGQIVSTLSTQSALVTPIDNIILKDDLARKFYVGMRRLERWSVRGLQNKIKGMVFERTAP